jgi:CheY-like chemotaxis protein
MAEPSSSSDAPPILLVDDDPKAAEILQALLAAGGVTNPLLLVPSSDAARAYLLPGSPPNPPPLPPLLVFIDLRMPGGDGLELLTWMQAQPELAGVPRVMLSAWLGAADVAHARAAGATACVSKYPSADALAAIVRLAHENARSISR